MQLIKQLVELASKTRMDPDASTAQKVGAVAGAGLGRAMSA